MSASLSIQHLEWDSAFFGFKIGAIRVSQLNDEEYKSTLETAKAQGYRLIYLFVYPVNDAAVSIAETQGAKLVDTKMTFEVLLDDAAAHHVDELITLFDAGMHNVGKLFDIAVQSGHSSRFKTDPLIPAGKFETMYHTWIENSLNGKIADEVLIYDSNGLAGMVTVKYGEEFATIGLFGVDANTRSQGIGKKLNDAVKEHTRQRGLKGIRVATQLENEGACRFYVANGYHECRREQILHHWL